MNFSNSAKAMAEGFFSHVSIFKQPWIINEPTL